MQSAEMKKEILRYVDDGGNMQMAYIAVKVAKEQKFLEQRKKETVKVSSSKI